MMSDALTDLAGDDRRAKVVPGLARQVVAARPAAARRVPLRRSAAVRVRWRQHEKRARTDTGILVPGSG